MSDKKMSKWLETELEMMKILEGYDKKDSNQESGSIDYVTGEGEEKKLLRILSNKRSMESKAVTKTITNMIDFLGERKYKHAVIIAEEITYGAKNLIRNTENLDYISPDYVSTHAIADILYAIQKKTIELCDSICGKVPTTEDECNGYIQGKYSCFVRKISDDSDFHAERGWHSLLYSDFSKLIEFNGKSAGKKRR
jgi:hypothetical protein